MRLSLVFFSAVMISSMMGCNRVGTYVASILPKKAAGTANAVTSQNASENGSIDDDTIRPENMGAGNQNTERKRDGFLAAPGGENFGNGYDQEEYQQMMGAGMPDPGSQMDRSNRPMGAMPGNPEYGGDSHKHPNEEMIGVGGDEYRLFAEGGLKSPGSDMFSNMAANFYSGIENANGEYASPVPQGLGPEAGEGPVMSENPGETPTGNPKSNVPDSIRKRPDIGQSKNTLSSQALVELTLEGAAPRLGDDVQVMSFAFRYQQLTAERLEGQFFLVINASKGGGVHAQPVTINGSGKVTVLTQLRPASRPFTAYLLMQQGDRRQMISRQIDVPFNPGF